MEQTDILKDLNPAQQEAVLHSEGPLLVLAGAGSGKTTVLTRRIAHIIHQGASPWSVIAITFTNKAAGELKERLESLLGPAGQDVWASTFHAACARILRRDIEKLGFDRSFTIYDTDDSVRVMRAALSDEGISDRECKPKAVLAAIGAAKDKMLTPSRYAAEVTGDYYGSLVAKAYATYQKRLREANALDFDDLIFHTVTLLEQHEDVRQYYQNKFRYVLVDEYQDTNRQQYRLTSLLAGKHHNICVVGDDDQSIYRFRGATIENILSFEKQYADAKVIRLEQNYRSTGHILDAANKLIANNEGRHGKTLWTGASRGDPVGFYRAGTDGDEAGFVATQIREGHAAGRPYKDFCVLYRMNALSNRMEDAFRRNGIPHRVVGGIRFYERAAVKDMLAYMALIHNHNDTIRLERIIYKPLRGVREKTLQVAHYLADRDGKSLFTVMGESAEYPELSRKARVLTEFVQMIESLSVDASEMPLPDFYEHMLKKTGYRAMLESKIAEGDFESQGDLENVMELGSSIVNYLKSMTEAGEPATLEGFLTDVALMTDIEQVDDNDDAALMMTIHTAKGLEFPVVFLVGAEENIFPGYRSLGHQDELEEERRLCYVAVTRAREKLWLTCAETRMLFGQTLYNPLSRFISELPSDMLETVAPEPPTVTSFSKRPSAKVAGRAPEPYKPAHKPTKPAITLTPGQVITHKAFGRGLVLSVTPMGGDALLEVAFDTVGTKRLMQNSATAFLTVGMV